MSFDPISSVLDVGKALIEKLIPDPKAKAEATQKLLELQQSGELAGIAQQAEINKIEAASSKLCVSGWRTFIGWICGSALAIQFIVGPLIAWGSRLNHNPLDLPPMNNELLTTLLIGMLGLGGLRTVEKLQGVASK